MPRLEPHFGYCATRQRPRSKGEGLQKCTRPIAQAQAPAAVSGRLVRGAGFWPFSSDKSTGVGTTVTCLVLSELSSWVLCIGSLAQTAIDSPYDEAGRPLRKGHLVEKTGAGQAYAAPMIQAEVFGEEATLGFDHDDYENRLDFYVSPNLRTGRLGQEQLARTLLGLLELQADVFAHRLALLAPALAVGAPTAESGSAG